MPRISAFYGVVIYIYAREHGVPHFHARHDEREAVVEIATGRVLVGGLPPRMLRLVQQWAGLHRDELLEAWNRAAAGEPPGTIEPLP